MGGGAPAAQAPTANWSNPLLGLIYCRRLRRWASGQTAAYYVGSRHRHLFLLFATVCRLQLQTEREEFACLRLVGD